MTLIDNLKWRYAAKKMNGKKVSQENLDYILEAARLAPSSSGLQPYKIFVISDKALLEKIKPIAFNQNQITDCSHLLVWAAWDKYSFERMGEVFTRTAKERGLPEDAMSDYHNRLWGMYESLGEKWHNNHAAKQAYISLSLAMAAAAELKIDATPMEGFLPDQFDELLDLKSKGLKSAVLLPIGYRGEGDWLVNLKKVRTPQEDFIIEMV
jgi:nitroreductase / dihydropteridine reductase